MANMEDVTRLPDDFDGRVRLFPLPELVVFPHAMQPLHIFEPRYCEMLLESLASDRLIAMATLTAGIGDLLSPKPALAPAVCICRIVSHAETAEGTHNILLVGAKRANLVREISTSRPFRMAEVEVITDVHPPMDAPSRKMIRVALLDAFASVIPASANVQQNLHELMAGQMGLGPITDIISFTLGFDCQAKLELLAQANVYERAQRLIQLLKKRSGQVHPGGDQSGGPPFGGAGGSDATKSPPPGFPPRFSLN